MAENNLDRLKSDIKLNNPARLYVFHGEEAYLRRYYLDSLKKLLVEDFAEAFNFHRFRPETITPQAVLDSIEALPMMAQRSMLQIDDVNFFALGEDAAAYAKFFSDIPDYCTVVLNYDTVEFRIDRRRKALAEVLDKAVVVEFTQPTERELVSWIGRHLKKQGKRITVEDAQYLIHRTGGGMTGRLGGVGHNCMRALNEEPEKSAFEEGSFHLLTVQRLHVLLSEVHIRLLRSSFDLNAQDFTTVTSLHELHGARYRRDELYFWMQLVDKQRIASFYFIPFFYYNFRLHAPKCIWHKSIDL